MDYTGRGRRYVPEQRSNNRSSSKNYIRLASGDYNGALPQIDRRRHSVSPRRHTRTNVGNTVSAVDEAVLSKLKREFELENRNGYYGNTNYSRVDRFGRRVQYPEGYREDIYYKPANDTINGTQRYYHPSDQVRTSYNGTVRNGTRSLHKDHSQETDNRKAEDYYDKQKHGRTHKDLKYETEKREKSTESKNEQKKETTQKPSFIRVKNLIDKSQLTDNLNKKANEEISCGHRCTGSLMTTLTSDSGPRKKTEIIEQAKDFLDQYYTNLKSKDSPEQRARLKEIQASVDKYGTYELSYDELCFGAKQAWRNAPRCIGRIQWSNLELFDARKVKTAREMFDAICRHIKYASNKGNIRSAITVFRQRLGDRRRDFRVYNQQILAYAGYKQPNGSIRGDPAYVEYTSFCQSLGWKGKNGRFDVLPMVVQADGQEPEWFDIPPELIMEVKIVHPNYPSFADLGLKWFGLPAVSSMMLDCGGIQFTGCPFSGWYMSTEVACRDFCDEQRYNLIEEIADKLGLDKSNNISLWKDKTIVETNIAVLHSFQLGGITIMDHHTASESFMTFMQNEHKLRGGCPADWVWIVPPMSGSLCPVFHQEMALYKLKPSYEYQDEIWRTYATRKDREKRGRKQKLTFRIVAKAAYFSSCLMTKVNAKRVKCTILFATETGKSEKFATTMYKIFKQTFNARLLNMENYNLADLPREQLLLFIASTFGNGHPPENGKGFANGLTAEKDKSQARRSDVHTSISNHHAKGQVLNGLRNIKFSAFGLGSRAYPHFCAFAHFLDDTMNSLGAKRIYSLGEGDELSGQEESFRNWAKNVYMSSCGSYNIKDSQGQKGAADMLDNSDMTWKPDRFRVVPLSTTKNISTTEELTRIHRKNVVTCRLKDRTRFEMSSGRLTILAKVDMRGNGSKLEYNPGDHVLLFPSNPSRLVEELLQYVKNAPDIDKQVKVEQRFVDSEMDKNGVRHANTETWQEYSRLPHCSLREILTSYVDITTPPTQDTLKDLSDMVTSREDQAKLKQLASTTNAYDQWKAAKMPTLVDVLRQFPSIRLLAAYLVVRLPLLQPRYYSISSSLDAAPGEIHITADVVKYQTPDGKPHKGLCSNWLNEVRVGQDILCAVKSAPLFHMPSNKTTPIIMVGPGTGVAPFRSFWMQRKLDMRKKPGNYGPMILYFGCRNSTTDNFFKEELAKNEFEGVLTKCHFAYSREPGAKKTYVQDLIKQNGKEVFQQIVQGHGHFYICGNIQMAADVKNMLLYVIQRHGNMTDSQSDAYLNKMKTEDRLHEDIFGLAVKKQ